MAYNELNYLLEVKNVQELTQEKLDKYVYINYKKIWHLLRQERRFFKSYATYLAYIAEAGVGTRIEELNENQNAIA